MKHCLHCNKLLTKRDNEQLCKFKKRTHCNRACRVEGDKIHETKTCEMCDTIFGRRRLHSGRLQTPVQFKDQKYCSQKCYRKAPNSWHRQIAESWEEAQKLLEELV